MNKPGTTARNTPTHPTTILQLTLNTATHSNKEASSDDATQHFTPNQHTRTYLVNNPTQPCQPGPPTREEEAAKAADLLNENGNE